MIFSEVKELKESFARQRRRYVAVGSLLLPLAAAGAWVGLATSPASSAPSTAQVLERCLNGTGKLMVGTDPSEPGESASYKGTFTGTGDTCTSAMGGLGTATVVPAGSSCIVSAPVIPGAKLVTNSGTYKVTSGTATMTLPVTGGPALLQVNTTLTSPGGGTATGLGTGTIVDTRLNQVCVTSKVPAGTYQVTGAEGTVATP
ncbi:MULTISPECIES: hypothetical protein [Streptomyces]|uniref:Uncharacterized protein n=1 Tax=Streptomyces yunnanensis TaxID=156453 RepID=A0ABY8AHL2_9ACTN|nr:MULTISPECIES: hypothetical protein [Streptomyces]WEB44482.1 hypothetical protein MOV08_37810 [Streptomyces yunnanensis]